MTNRNYLVVGGTSGIGLEISRSLVDRGDSVVLTGRDHRRAQTAADALGGRARGLAVDLAQPRDLSRQLESIGRIDGLVLCGVERDVNSVRDFDLDRATRMAMIKLIGYTETIHAIGDRLPAHVDSSIVLFGGIARYRPYPGSLTVSTVNGGVEGLAAALAVELAPIRVNVLHPGIIGDSPFWAGKDEALARYRARTPGGELATMGDVVGATVFLLDNRGVSGERLHVSRATLAS